MHRQAGRIAVLALAIAVITLAAARFGMGADGAAAQSATSVAIAGFAYAPATVQVPAGSTIIWSNADAAPHTVTADAGAFGSEVLGTGGAFTATFDAPGSFAYHCLLHPGMTGTVVVTP